MDNLTLPTSKDLGTYTTDDNILFKLHAFDVFDNKVNMTSLDDFNYDIKGLRNNQEVSV